VVVTVAPIEKTPLVPKTWLILLGSFIEVEHDACKKHYLPTQYQQPRPCNHLCAQHQLENHSEVTTVFLPGRDNGKSNTDDSSGFLDIVRNGDRVMEQVGIYQLHGEDIRVGIAA